MPAFTLNSTAIFKDDFPDRREIVYFSSMMSFFRYGLALYLLILTCLIASAEEINPFSIPRYSIEYSAQRDPAIDGNNALAYAKQTQRKVLIEVGGDWCQWCHKLDQFIQTHPTVRQQLHAQFVILKVNVSADNKNAEFMASMPPVDGYPHIYITDAEGAIQFSGDLTQLISFGRFSEKKFLSFLDQWK